MGPVPQRSPQSIIGPALMTSGVLTVVVGVVLALAVEPVLALIAVVGIIDFGLAWAYATGRLGSPRPQAADDLPRSTRPRTRRTTLTPYAREG